MRCCLNEYFSRDRITGEYFDGERYQTIEFTPQQSDLDYLRTFKFEDLTFRGTIEYRSTCCQPFSEALTVAAFHTGLKEKLPELKELLEQDNVIYTHGFSAAELQKLLSKRTLPTVFDEKAIEKQLIRILDLAADGLRKRQRGEESLLAPLYRRAKQHTNPAKAMLDGIAAGVSLKTFVARYAEI